MDSGNKKTLYLRRYKCRKCNKLFQTKVPEEFDSNNDSYIPLFIKDYVHKLASTMRIPLEKISEIIKMFTNIDISYETIRRYMLNDDDLTYYDDGDKSGYYGYDAQWVLVDKKYVPKGTGVTVKNHKNRVYIFRLSLFDLIRNKPVAEKISFTETPKDIETFINHIVAPKDRKAIVTDLNPEYDKVMRNLGFTHQGCKFHLMKLINKTLKNEMKNIKSDLRKNNPDKNSDEINKLAQAEKKKIDKWMKWFWQLFEKETIEEALEFIEQIRSQLKDAPSTVNKVLNDKFMPQYRKFLRYLEKPHKGKLDSTNNKIENYFGTTLSRPDKKKLRTPQAIATQTHHTIQHWNKNNKNPLRM